MMRSSRNVKTGANPQRPFCCDSIHVLPHDIILNDTPRYLMRSRNMAIVAGEPVNNPSGYVRD